MQIFQGIAEGCALGGPGAPDQPVTSGAAKPPRARPLPAAPRGRLPKRKMLAGANAKSDILVLVASGLIEINED